MPSGTALAEVRARRALEDAHLDASVPLERASSVTNEVWLTESHVIRVNRYPNNRLLREAELVEFLPDEVRYPEIVGHGGQPGKDWLITVRTPGRPLARCWPGMPETDRRDAVRQLATMLRAVHQTREPIGLASITTAPQLLDRTGLSAVAPLLEGLHRAASLQYVEKRIISEALTLVSELAESIEPFITSTLIHGDLTLENVLWHEGEITSLVDFEWSRAAPADLDLDILLRFCAFPNLHVAEDYEHLVSAEAFRSLPWWLREDYPELFAFRFQMERMRVYALAYDVRELLAYPPKVPAAQLSPHHPYMRIRNLIDGHSHLDGLRGAAT